MLQYELTQQQYNELAGLAYHNANKWLGIAYGEQNEGDAAQANDDVRQHFPALDALGVPYWVQNTVLVWSENRERYEREYMRDFLKTKNITVKPWGGKQQ